MSTLTEDRPTAKPALEDMATLADVPRYQASIRPDKVALEFEGRETTFGEFDRHTSQVARALIAEGLKKGDHIAYLGKNSDHFFELFFGAAKAGVILAPARMSAMA